MYNTTYDDTSTINDGQPQKVNGVSEAYQPFPPDGTEDEIAGSLYADTRRNDLQAKFLDGPRTPSYMQHGGMADGGSIVRTVTTVAVVGLAGYGVWHLFFKQ